MRTAAPLLIRSSPIAIASVPVLQALELVVTWFPRANCPETRAETPLAITCSTAVDPMRRTFLASVRGTTFSAVVSMPPIPVPMMAPVSQSTVSESRAGRSSPASRQASRQERLA